VTLVGFSRDSGKSRDVFMKMFEVRVGKERQSLTKCLG
jgi:hypothetical protein